MDDEISALYRELEKIRRLINAGDRSEALASLQRLRPSDAAFIIIVQDLAAVYEAALAQVEEERRTLNDQIDGLAERHASLTRALLAKELASKPRQMSRSFNDELESVARIPPKDTLVPRRGIPRGDNFADGLSPPKPDVLPDPQELTPHLDIARNKANGLIRVDVFLDRSEFRKGESGRRVVAEPGSLVQAQLITTEHFEIVGAAHMECEIVADAERYNFPEFLVRPLASSSEIPGQPAISVLFTVDGRASGNVKRAVDLEGNPVSLPREGASGSVELVRELGDKADLTITVMNNPINDGRQFICVVTSPHLPAYQNGKAGPWNMSDRSQAIVANFMQGFTDPATKASGLVAALRGAGKELFDASPAVFRDAFWELMAAGKPPSTIAVVSEEPFIPWELMVPNGGPDDLDNDTPLGVNYTVGRWIYQAKAARRSIKISDSRVFAPKYSGTLVLGMAEAEADAVIKVYPGRIISPVSFDQIAEEMLGGPSLIHFVCHGKDDNANGQFILLDDDQKLTDTNLRGISGLSTVFKTNAPIVFLNACEVGRGNPSLVGPRGFAAQFIKLGAQAVIAPLWSVDDQIAHEIAVEFYDKVKKQPDRRFAEIFKDIRSRAYASGRDSYAAYCFFGDPLAAAS